MPFSQEVDDAIEPVAQRKLAPVEPCFRFEQGNVYDAEVVSPRADQSAHACSSLGSRAQRVAFKS